MADSRKLVNIFLASPGDLSDERRIAKTVADEVNTIFANAFGYQVELIGWEDTVSVFGRPQATINRDLERCELFIGMVWKKWGTPPDTTGAYASGFEEEFELSVARRAREGRPEISLFFKNIDEQFMRDPGDQLQKVIAFKKKIVDTKLLLFEDFSEATFATKLRRCISAYLITLQKKDSADQLNRTQAPATPGGTPQVLQPGPQKQDPISDESMRFVNAFLPKTEDATQAVSPAEVARFRLLGTLFSRPGNDDPVLGIHDSNLLYHERANVSFGRRELNGLVLRESCISLVRPFRCGTGYQEAKGQPCRLFPSRRCRR